MTEVKRFIVLVTSEQNVYETLRYYGKHHAGVPLSFRPPYLGYRNSLPDEEVIFARAAAKFQPLLVLKNT